jgi:hypothetical protein
MPRPRLYTLLTGRQLAMSSCDKSQMRKKTKKKTRATAKMTVMMAEATTATRSEGTSIL